jgi:hypothetical protein
VIQSNPRHQAAFLATSGLRFLPQLRSNPARLRPTTWVFCRRQYSEYDKQRGGGVAFSAPPCLDAVNSCGIATDGQNGDVISQSRLEAARRTWHWLDIT